MPKTNNTSGRTLGDLSVKELLDSAIADTLALGKRLDTTTLPDDDRLVLSAYVGSIGARLSVAIDRLG